MTDVPELSRKSDDGLTKNAQALPPAIMLVPIIQRHLS